MQPGLISSQLSVELTNDGSDKEQYDNIKKVYSIWICMDCPEDKKDSIINYSFEPHIIYQGNDKLKLYKNCDLMNITFIHLSGKPDQSHHQLISMLDTLLARMDAETKKKKLKRSSAFEYHKYLIYLLSSSNSTYLQHRSNITTVFHFTLLHHPHNITYNTMY